MTNFDRTIQMLLVEDNPADAWLLKEMIFRWTNQVQIKLITDGEEAEKYLQEDVATQKATRPDVIILDLNLPKVDGRVLLKEIRMNDALSSIPVFILTSSSLESDKKQCEASQADLYLTKPSDLTEFVQLVQHLVDVDIPVAMERGHVVDRSMQRALGL